MFVISKKDPQWLVQETIKLLLQFYSVLILVMGEGESVLCCWISTLLSAGVPKHPFEDCLGNQR